MVSKETIKKLVDARHFPLWGIVASTIGLVFILGAMIPYEGTIGEPFSIFNHFVSELGELGVSEFAMMFNIGMILAGFTYIPFMIGFAIYLDNIISKIAGLVGVFTSISIIFVGIFPMNYSMEHYSAAMSFFLSGMIMVVLWAIAIFIQQALKIPKYMALGGVINFIIFALFLFGDWGSLNDVMARPDFHMIPTLEWGIYFAIIGYLLLISLFTWKRSKATIDVLPYESAS